MAFNKFSDEDTEKHVTLEDGAMDEVSVMALANFLGENGLVIGQDWVIRKKDKKDLTVNAG